MNKFRLGLVFSALFAALIAVSGFFIVPLPVGIPIVLKNMFVVLSGTILGGFYSGISILIFIFAGLIGIPIFVIPGGPGVFLTPLGGYIIGYFFGSITAGFISGKPSVNEEKPRPISILRISIGSFTGFSIILLCGSFYMMFLNKMTLASSLAAGILPFLIGDAVKFALSIPLALFLRPVAARYLEKREMKNIDVLDHDSKQQSSNSTFLIPNSSFNIPCPLSPVPSPSVIKLDNISKHFTVFNNNKEEQFLALDDITLSIKKGECTVIAGSNGSGKTLLMTIIAGLETPSLGTVTVNERVGLVFQEPDAQILGETPLEDIAFGPRNLKLSREECNRRVEAALEETGLRQKAAFPARFLSGGEKRRLAAAGILAMDAQIIIFDEPYANLDYPGIVQVNALFKKLKAGGKTLIILTHELEKCMALADKFIVLFKGKKAFDGEPSQALLLDLESFGIRHPLKNNAQELEELLWK